jgi:hypothetical protein
MASNTKILIKRSLVNNKPTTLNQGELAFSYTSNTLFIGTSGSNDAFEVAGTVITVQILFQAWRILEIIPRYL